ncbi:hypothetical protein F3Y22_tig00014304pilonHSYRG00093 [Hibiscus syriacus]|uniref:Reverse transcriptase zinc-binding domain-containing protein n=1 Tax=Hibiscus syriacus TaxID=106335 RepID=A0A6A3BZJ3_HIBSY|nr:hypothetical protein F3Y22_tig00014304pilonHSYRG00093 [Hibiscus syriacus]
METFGFLRDKVAKRIQGWSHNLLSYGGREVFLKFVVQALPTYVMSCYLLPDVVVEAITSLRRAYWWSGKYETRGWAHVAWNKVCRAKRDRGVGFRDLKLFNMVLLGKQVWKFLHNPSSLLFQRGSTEEWALIALRLYTSTRWGGSHSVALNSTYVDNEEQPIMCGDFMIQGAARWMKTRSIAGIERDRSPIWKIISKLPTLPKIKIFGWRVCHDALPTGHKLVTAGLGNRICPMCQSEVETALHALKDCLNVNEILVLSGLNSGCVDMQANTRKSWLEEIVSSFDRDDFIKLLTLLWSNWFRRNKWVHDKELQEARDVVNTAWIIRTEIKNVHDKDPNLNKPLMVSNIWWIKPTEGIFKINIDMAFLPITDEATIGVIARDHHEMVYCGMTKKLQGTHTAESVEAVVSDYSSFIIPEMETIDFKLLPDPNLNFHQTTQNSGSVYNDENVANLSSENFQGQALKLPENNSFVGNTTNLFGNGDFENSLMAESPTGFKVGRYSPEERQERISKYRAKRNRRNFNKTIKGFFFMEREVDAGGSETDDVELSDCTLMALRYHELADQRKDGN